MSTTSSLKPYVGLIPFHEEDADFFFGREQEQEIITSNLIASRLTLLYGSSGVGKSSVLHAGVAHNLRGLARRDIKRRGKPQFTVVIFSAWRDEPIKSLLEQVQKAVKTTLAGKTIAPVSRDLPFVDSLREWSRRVEGRLLIILDQFEEYFLYHPNEEGDGTFAVEFPRAVNTPGLPVNFIVSYREDAHSKLDFFKGTIPNLYDNYLRIGHLGYDAARAAIVKPIARYNELNRLDQQHAFGIQDELVAAVLSQVRAGESYLGETGKGVVSDHAPQDDKNWEVETPYLQLVMEQLWDTEVQNGSRILQLETLNKLGGAKRIVQTHLDNAMGQLSTTEQLMGASIFNHLVTRSGTKIAQTTHDLAGYANLSTGDENQLDLMMEKLTGGDRRILRAVPPPANQPNARRYEVFHDVLALAILDWRGRFLARKQRVRFWKVLGGMAAIILLMGGVTAFALQQRAVARTAEGRAKLNEELAKREAVRAEDNARKAALSAQAENLRAFENQKLAASNKELADKFEQAYQSERIAKSEADKERVKAVAAAKVAEVQRGLAVRAASDAELQRKRAAEAAKFSEEQKLLAVVAAKEAKRQQTRADRALLNVKEIDASNAYYKTVIRPGGDVIDASFSLDGQKALAATSESVFVWDVNSKFDEPTHVLELQNVWVKSAAFSPNGKFIIVVTNQQDTAFGVATIWDLSGVSPVAVGDISADHYKEGEPSMLFGAAFISNGSVVVFSSTTAKICKWDAVTKKLEKACRTFNNPDSAKITIINSISPDGRYIVRENPDSIVLLDTNTNSTVKLAQPETSKSSLGTKVAFSPDGKSVATTGPYSGAYLFEISSGRLIGEFQSKSPAAKLTFSSRGHYLAAANADGYARVWNTRNMMEVNALGGHSAPLTDVAFSRDGKYLVTASADRTARVWDLASGARFAELRGHVASVISATFSPGTNGDFILTSGDKTARVWDVTRSTAGGIYSSEATMITGEYIDLDAGHKNPVQVLGVSPADLSWKYTTKKNPAGTSDLVTWFLNPENKAQVGFFSDDKASQAGPSVQRKFEDISVTELLGLNYSSTSITGGAVADRSGGEVINTLAAGSIFAVRTTEGNYAKVQVLERAPILKIKWVTYNDPNRQSPPPAPRSAQALQLKDLLQAQLGPSSQPLLQELEAALNGSRAYQHRAQVLTITTFKRKAVKSGVLSQPPESHLKKFQNSEDGGPSRR